jgi:hypothetical protein
MSYKLVQYSDSTFRKLFSFIIDKNFWTTYRFPFQKQVTISYPDCVVHPEESDTIKHEIFHVKQFEKWYGPIIVPLFATILPLPILFSGRWFIERQAYLYDIRRGVQTVDSAIDILWNDYGYCWPKSLMRKWFIKQLTRS